MPVTALKQALEKLNTSLVNLESCVSGLEDNLAGQQRDMFGGHATASNENVNTIDAALVAKRLDIAIERVEQVLSEAATA